LQRTNVSDSPPAVPLWHRSVSTLEERAQQIEQLEREMRTQKRRLYLRYGSEYLLWLVVGAFLLFWSFHTTDSRYARLAFWGGIGLGDGGMLLALIRGRNDAERCGLL
jgi:hypothetical protein